MVYIRNQKRLKTLPSFCCVWFIFLLVGKFGVGIFLKDTLNLWEKSSWVFKPSTPTLMAGPSSHLSPLCGTSCMFYWAADRVCVCVCVRVKAKCLSFIMNNPYCAEYLTWKVDFPSSHSDRIHTQTHTCRKPSAHSWGQLDKLKHLHFSFECSMISIIGINKPILFGGAGSFLALVLSPITVGLLGKKPQNKGLINWVNYSWKTSPY